MRMVPGVDVVNLEDLSHPFSDLADTPDEWHTIFERSQEAIRTFLAAHDPFEVLAKCVNQVMAGAAQRKENPRWAEGKIAPYQLMEPAELEILQALALMQLPPRKMVPASPGSMDRFFPEIPKSTFAFSRMQPPHHPNDPEREHLISKIRLHTIVQRNLFLKDDCEAVVLSIFRQIDDRTISELGFAFSEMFSALVAVRAKIEARLNAYLDHLHSGVTAKSEAGVLEQVDFFCSISSMAKRTWAKCRKHCKTLDDYRMAAFQLSELCHSWVGTLDKSELRAEFGDGILAFFEKISLRPGALAGANPEHFFMNNPVWRKPFVALSEDTLFLPLPNLIYGFPFQIFEQFLDGHPGLEKAYSAARAKYLEDSIETHIATGLPSAKTYQKVMWRDEDTGNLYENDLVAVIGNTIFLFEAKSGKLDDVARRGGELSLLRNFKELFVDPGEQATRLESYLNTKGNDARLWIKGSGEIVRLDLRKPKMVHKFSICIEHFAALTSAKHNIRVLGAIKDENAWAPVLSLGELMLVWRYLDTEISFFHYLTRRATLEDAFDFEGDEQDILSMYLINGLCIDSEKVKGRQLRFLNIDGVVRTGKRPRPDRTEFEVLGVSLWPYWLSVLEEIYRDVSLRHRFDILQVVLNQNPQALAGISDFVRKWKRGLASGRKRDVMLVRQKIGKRVFVLAYHLAKWPLSEEEWIERSRTIAREVAARMLEASDCAILLRIKKSKEKTFDGFSFHRLGRAPHD